jgi:outer membrane protein OmpA-like peptidoglycan-associated protein
MRPVLDPLAQGLDPAMRLRIVGHTDGTGSVREHLAGRGVAASRVDVAGRAMNRRVEIFRREPQALSAWPAARAPGARVRESAGRRATT